MNTTILRGNLVKDPEIKTVTTYSGKETKVTNFILAVSRFYEKANGEREKDTTFVPCELWSTSAEAVHKHFKKGDPMLLEGSLKSESWEKDGQKRTALKVRVNRFERLYRKNQDNDIEEEEEN